MGLILSVNLLALTWITALASAAALTPLVISLMWHFRIVDAPDGVRKLHGRTVPLVGGLAVLGGCFLASAVSLLLMPQLLLTKRAVQKSLKLTNKNEILKSQSTNLKVAVKM